MTSTAGLGLLNRRRFVQSAGLAGFGLLVGCGRLPWQAAPAPRIPRIGFFVSGAAEGQPGGAFREGFLQGLRDHGYEEGQNIVIEWRTAEGPDEAPSVAAELVRLPVDAIVAPSGFAAAASKQATSTIPIVFVTVADPVSTGLVDSLARPGGNVTGTSSLFDSLAQKRLELLKQAAPHASRVVYLYDPSQLGGQATMDFVTAVAGPLGIVVEPLPVRAAEDFALAFEAATRVSADALLVSQGALIRRQMPRILNFAATHRLPAMYAWQEAVDAGGLMSYGPNTPAQFRRAAFYVDRILKGARPADLPVEQPTRFDFVVNLKTARELGLTFPPEIQLQITAVVE